MRLIINPTCAVRLIIIPTVQCASLSSHLCIAPHYHPTCAVCLITIPPVHCASLSSHLCIAPHYHPTCALRLIIIPPVQCASLPSHLIIILLLFSCAELDEVTVQLFKQSNKRTFGDLTKVSFVLNLKCSLVKEQNLEVKNVSFREFACPDCNYFYKHMPVCTVKTLTHRHMYAQ